MVYKMPIFERMFFGSDALNPLYLAFLMVLVFIDLLVIVFMFERRY